MADSKKKSSKPKHQDELDELVRVWDLHRKGGTGRRELEGAVNRLVDKARS